MPRLCLACNEPLVGRSDKKFCDDQCRNDYNNKLNSDENNFMRNVNNILRKNRKILQALCPNGKSSVLPKSKLISKGLNFEYYTNVLNTKTGATYYYCYEYGYKFVENDEVMVVEKK